MNSELSHKAGNNAEECDIGEVAGADQIIKAIGTVRRQRTSHFDREWTLGGFETGLKSLRSFFLKFGRIREIRRRRFLFIRFLNLLFALGRPNNTTGDQCTSHANPNESFHNDQELTEHSIKSRADFAQCLRSGTIRVTIPGSARLTE